MKKLSLLSAILLFFISMNAQNTFPSTGAAGIGTTTPNSSSLLDVTSTTKGVLVPRMTKTQRDAITTPATGLLIYQTNSTPGFYYYSGSAWTAVSPKPKGWSLTGNAGTNATADFIGTTDNVALTFKVNNSFAGRLDPSSLSTSFGLMALAANTSGVQNTAFGAYTLASNTSGYQNTAIGDNTLGANTTGLANTAVGNYVLYLSNGNYNTGIGQQTLNNNSTGSANTATGLNALYLNTSGSGNTATGFYALVSNGTGSNNTALGDSANVNAPDLTNAMALGFKAITTASNKVVVGNANVTVIGGQVGWSTLSDGRLKTNLRDYNLGLDFIKQLQPKSYTYTNNQNGNEHQGFIAQDVEKILNGKSWDGLNTPRNENDFYSINYSALVVPLVNAVKDLSKQNDDLKNELEELKSSIAKLESSTTDGVLKSVIQNPQSEMALLGQNIPNPFGNSTLIPFHIPKDCHDASIMITNTSTSDVVSVIPVSCNEDHVSVDAGTLASGMYSYTLYVDGKMIDTKSMLLQK